MHLPIENGEEMNIPLETPSSKQQHRKTKDTGLYCCHHDRVMMDQDWMPAPVSVTAVRLRQEAHYQEGRTHSPLGSQILNQ